MTPGFHLWVRKMPWRRKLPSFLGNPMDTSCSPQRCQSQTAKPPPPIMTFKFRCEIVGTIPSVHGNLL